MWVSSYFATGAQKKRKCATVFLTPTFDEYFVPRRTKNCVVYYVNMSYDFV